MSEADHSETESKAELPAWLALARRVINIVFPVVLGALMIFAAWPREKIPDSLRGRRDALTNAMRKISLSQSWSMYAPDPGRGHFYMEITAYDADGNARKLEDSRMAEEGWGTAWAWKRTRMDIWQHTVSRRPDRVSRNRTWYLRGVCLREARRGHEVRRLEMRRVFRRIRSPAQVREGAEPLGPMKWRKVQDTSCNVEIIRDMIASDPLGAPSHEQGDDG